MPRLTRSHSSMQTVNTGVSQFRFSAIRPQRLAASEYTLATIVVDTTSSVASFKNQLLDAVKAVVTSCFSSPRADNLLVRLMTFNSSRTEVHGFKPLADIDPAKYKAFNPSGMTALYDACYDAVLASNRFAATLIDQHIAVNAAIYIITDGFDNQSQTRPEQIAREINAARNKEQLESFLTVLMGINTADNHVKQHLAAFRQQAQLDEYIDAGAASAEHLARLAAFVSHSIHTQSIALSGAGNSLRF